MFYKIERYKTFDGKEHSNLEYLNNHIESVIGQEIEKILSLKSIEIFGRVDYITQKRILLALSDIDTAKEILQTLKKILEYGKE